MSFNLPQLGSPSSSNSSPSAKLGGGASATRKLYVDTGFQSSSSPSISDGTSNTPSGVANSGVVSRSPRNNSGNRTPGFAQSLETSNSPSSSSSSSNRNSANSDLSSGRARVSSEPIGTVGAGGASSWNITVGSTNNGNVDGSSPSGIILTGRVGATASPQNRERLRDSARSSPQKLKTTSSPLLEKDFTDRNRK